jgi:plasmid replication initiation protein
LIRPDDNDLKVYQIPKEEFGFLIENDNYTRLKSECKKLMSQVLEVPRDGDGWLLSHWFSDIEYKKEGFVEVSFSRKLKPYLIELKNNFSSVYLSNVLKLSSEYAIRIYEMMKQYQKIGSRTIELLELHDLFQTPKSYRKLYGDFKKRVLEIATKDINSKTDLNITYKEIKTGRSVTAIHFTIKANKKALENEQDETPTLLTGVPEHEYDDINDLRYNLNYFNDNPANKKMMIGNEVHYLDKLYFDAERGNKLTLKTDRDSIQFPNKNLKKVLIEVYQYIEKYNQK